jgi:hypothetical protein
MRCSGRAAEVGRALDVAEVALFHLLQHMVGARRHFEAGHQLAVDQLAAAVVQAVIIGVDRQHLLFSGNTGVGHSGGRPARRTANGQKGINMAS